jgi:hypothetical protein
VADGRDARDREERARDPSPAPRRDGGGETDRPDGKLDDVRYDRGNASIDRRAWATWNRSWPAIMRNASS